MGFLLDEPGAAVTFGGVMAGRFDAEVGREVVARPGFSIRDVRRAFGDPRMAVCRHSLWEMRTLLPLAGDMFVDGQRWAVHADGRVWMGRTRQDALRKAMACVGAVP
jgi:hypothetical protein